MSMTYRQLLCANHVNYEDIDVFKQNYYTRVRGKNEQRTLAEYLGLTDEEYKKYEDDPHYLEVIKHGKNS